MQAQIIMMNAKQLVGFNSPMSIMRNKTQALWKRFMKQNTIESSEFIAMQIYGPDYFSTFDPTKAFQQWACVEVDNLELIPEEMAPVLIPAGLYAKFNYKGPSTDHSIYDYIYRQWLPKSKYTIDNRPHFQVMGEKYSNTSSDSEEEIWIPILNK
ncbi:GyrI-like domain-containing protein [Cyclobacterium marinum]|uniref:Transcription activator effector binding protein n=1 Tax=Cyclobacterium marinum (strain ATCC 25205 / DSM 745 / LMG 13164 / NCIMB 1802) TaxID=880070 RepID=G0IUS5_CYCMS|nr:effector binding domain-containing protein [Cyclobacterium marinum]AEL25467.1 transcription activator effector binding protein [Cyclobacterium marinum DSM 745]